jgi:hypothetical protein
VENNVVFPFHPECKLLTMLKSELKSVFSVSSIWWLMIFFLFLTLPCAIAERWVSDARLTAAE